MWDTEQVPQTSAVAACIPLDRTYLGMDDVSGTVRLDSFTICTPL